ncbi:MAG: aspartate-semialdehyde dehydrogenase [Bacillota bacterium]|nr:aspartate-semialdehyde dehydrogenase [Bacillota bacterium]
MAGKRVAILGATGLVGQKVIEMLVERKFPLACLRLLATSRTAGSFIRVLDEELRVEAVGPDSFRGIDLCFFAATAAASKQFAPTAVESDAVVIDKSSAFRMDPEVPLVVPEVNPHHLRSHRGVIASPNCSTIQLVVPLKPIEASVGISRVVVSTYQSVSGTGKDAMEELRDQTDDALHGRPVRTTVYDRQIAFNLIPQVDEFMQDDYTGEEWKMVLETRKILERPDLPITATCVRVPVFVSHSESVLIETRTQVRPSDIRSLLSTAPSVVVVDNPAERRYAVPLDAEGSDNVLVSRVRRDLSHERGIWMWIVCDNLRKGAATNAVQIAESLMVQGLL